MKMFDTVGTGVSRKFLVASSAYRRMAKDRPGLDWSLDRLVEQYEWESRGTGTKPCLRTNGYAVGKWVLDATLKAIKEDIESGLVCKHEFRDACAFVRRFVKALLPVEWYPVRDHLGRLG